MRKIRKTPNTDGELGWLETTPNSHVALGPRLKGAHEFDVAIIGAGFTGLSVALRLAELHPSMRIAIVDALRVGQGTSGRNAGFLIDLPHNVNFAKTGRDYALSLYRLNQFAIERLRQFKDKLSIPFWDEAGKYMAVHEPRNEKGIAHFEGMLKQAGFPYEIVSGSDLARRLGTDYYTSAVYTTGNVLVNPAALVRGLVTALPANVSLFENSPVQSIEYGPPHRLNFLGGTVSARVVVQATNSFAEEFGKLRNRVVPIYTYASLTKPIPDDLLRQYFDGVKSWGLTSAHLAGATVRFTHDNRIFVRNMYDYHSGLRTTDRSLQKAWRMQRSSFDARFPFLKDLPFEYTWGGMIAMTGNYKPVFANPGDGVYVISGCNGVGVVKGTYLGYYMAEFVSGMQSKDLQFVLETAKPIWVPPSPLAGTGATARIAWEAVTAKGDA